MKRSQQPPDHTVGSRIGYRIDRFLALHPASQIVAVISSVIVLAFLFGCVIVLIDDSTGTAPDQTQRVGGVLHGLWWAITRMLDGGTVASDSGPLRQVFGIGVTLIGTIAVAILTGSFASSFSERLGALRRGALPVFEEGHLVFLGWNTHGSVILRELAVSGIRATIVIVADHDRDVLEEGVREQLERRDHKLQVIIRRGDPTTTASARRAAVHAARAVVILPEVPSQKANAIRRQEGSPLSPIPDLERAALRSLLAVRRVLGGVKRPVIVEVTGPRGRELTRLCDADDAVVVDGHGVNARLLAQSVRQDGAFNVIQQLLSLDDRSVFVHPAGALVGKTFDEAHAAIDRGILLGIARDNTAVLSPAGDHLITSGDHLLVLSEDDKLSASGSLPVVEERTLLPDEAADGDEPAAQADPRSLSVLVIRYRPELAEILRFLDARGDNRVKVMVSPADVPQVREALEEVELTRTRVEVIGGNPLDGGDIERELSEPRDVALLLAPEVSGADIADADADQLITLLHLRRVGALRTVMEIRSEETRHLTRAIPRQEDFLIKRETVGMLLAQELHAICLQRPGAWVGPIYHAILEAIGPSVEIRPMAAYAGDDPEPTFARILAAARAKGQIAIGVARGGARPKLMPRREDRFKREGSRVVVLHASSCTKPT